jgi:hypothetical protein
VRVEGGGVGLAVERGDQATGLNRSNFNHGAHSVILTTALMLKQKQLKNEGRSERERG